MMDDAYLIYDIVDEYLGRSDVLKSLGYGARIREHVRASAHLTERFCFHVVPAASRCLSICIHIRESGNHLFTVEIVNTQDDDSFLLEDWTRPQRNPNDPYPFLLSAYSGDFKNRLQQFLAFMEKQLGTYEINMILKGLNW